MSRRKILKPIIIVIASLVLLPFVLLTGILIAFLKIFLPVTGRVTPFNKPAFPIIDGFGRLNAYVWTDEHSAQ